MNEWWLSLHTTLDQVWLRLGRGVVDRKADARHPIFATAGAGGPEARIVVLRQADRALSAVSVFTDMRSAKITDLRYETRASLLVWEQKARLQIRLRVHVEITSGAAVPSNGNACRKWPEKYMALSLRLAHQSMIPNTSNT